jgi:hypothetical protein
MNASMAWESCSHLRIIPWSNRQDPVGSDNIRHFPIGIRQIPMVSDSRKLSDSDVRQLPAGFLRPGFRQFPTGSPSEVVGSYRNISDIGRFLSEVVENRRIPIGSDRIWQSDSSSWVYHRCINQWKSFTIVLALCLSERRQRPKIPIYKK